MRCTTWRRIEYSGICALYYEIDEKYLWILPEKIKLHFFWYPDPPNCVQKKVELAFDALMSLEENSDLANFMKAPVDDDGTHSELGDIAADDLVRLPRKSKSGR